MEIDVGRLLRLRAMTQSAAESVEADGNGAAALTQGYGRLRRMVRDTVEGSGASLDEFDEAFPDLPVVEHTGHEDIREVAMRETIYAPQAREARALLGQLAGWITGILEEQEYRRRLEQAD